METKLRNLLLDLNPELLNKKYLLAVSGGADSVALFHLFKTLDLNFEVGHCNFNLRGEESVKDEQFVQNLCLDAGIQFHSKQFDTIKEQEIQKESIQMIARKLRYVWFASLKKELQYDYLVTAHHLDDRIETFFINLFRGTGIKGLSPLAYFNGSKFRPLIQFSKTELLAYLKKNSFDFRIDQSNLSDKYDRNKIRLNILPKIEQEFPEYRARFKQTFSYLEKEKDLIEELKLAFYANCISNALNTIWIELKDLDSPLKTFWFCEYIGGSASQTSEIQKLIPSQKGSKIPIGQGILTREEKAFCFSFEKDFNINLVVNASPFENEFLKIELIHTYPLQFLKDKLYLDADKISFPLTVRTWEFGDRIQPLGMKGTKLISDLLTDKKVQNTDRNHVLIVAIKNEILGVLGGICSEKYKIQNGSKNILELTLIKAIQT